MLFRHFIVHFTEAGSIGSASVSQKKGLSHSGLQQWSVTNAAERKMNSLHAEYNFHLIFIATSVSQ